MEVICAASMSGNRERRDGDVPVCVVGGGTNPEGGGMGGGSESFGGCVVVGVGLVVASNLAERLSMSTVSLAI